jgi:tRNA pseudouridine55 synthase
MDGVFVLDKPGGMTSQEAVDRVKRVFKVKRAGHTGTLDPFATGVLPICLGGATRIIPFLDEDFKEYVALLRLGITTDTMDLTGKIVNERGISGIGEEDILEVFSRFKGSVLQTPPMFSALKKNGIRLYDLARQGKEVERGCRTVEIKELRVLDISLPLIRFSVTCSRGTYVRVLGSDIGDRLGCGGHLVELRRTRSGRFTLEDAVSMEDIEGGVDLIPMGDALSHIGYVSVTKGIAKRIRQGQQIRKSYLDSWDVLQFEAGDRLRVYEGSELVSIAEALVSSRDLDKLDDKTVIIRLLRVFN